MCILHFVIKINKDSIHVSDKVEIDNLPSNYDSIKLVQNSTAFIDQKLDAITNVVALPRSFGISNAFNSLADKMFKEIQDYSWCYTPPRSTENLIIIDENDCKAVLKDLDAELTTAERQAGNIILGDLSFCNAKNPSAYIQLEAPKWRPETVQLWHHDESTLPKNSERYSCVYNIGGTALLKNDDAERIDKTRNYSQKKERLSYQFGCNTMIRFSWVNEEKDNDVNPFIHCRQDLKDEKHVRMMLLTYPLKL